MQRWREAMQLALYGPDGFFRRTGSRPADHFRTSAHAGTAFAAAMLRVLDAVDAALDRPDRLDVVDIGAGDGELLTAMLALAPVPLAGRLYLTGVEIAARPAGLPERIAWSTTTPEHIRGLLVATEWLDNVPVDVATRDPSGQWRYLLVDEYGEQAPGDLVPGTDLAWLHRWWPVDEPGTRAEIGTSRDAAWADAVSLVDRGLALTVDYGHLVNERPPLGTLTGYRGGREVRPVPDGCSDLTAHVAIDAVAAAGATMAGRPAALLRQGDVLAALGTHGSRPPIALAHTDPAGYLRALAGASSAAELTAAGGLGDHFWLWQPVALDLPAPTMQG